MQTKTDEVHLTDDNHVTATACKAVFRIQLAIKSFYIFAILSTFIQVWCLVRFAQSVLHPAPPISTYSEIDIAEKVAHAGDTDSGALRNRLRSMDSSAVIRECDRLQLYVRQIDPNAGYTMGVLHDAGR
jgi:hypothetical protein